MMQTRSIAMNLPPLQTFQLEPPVLLPAAPAGPYQRTQSLAWSDQQVTRPTFFEPVQTNSYGTNTYIPVPQTPGPSSSQYYTAPPPIQPIIQYQPAYVPSVGSANYTFTPYAEYDEKYNVQSFQNISIRPELSHKSPEELRLEDYAANNVATLVASGNQPGAVDMGLNRTNTFNTFAQQPTQGTSLFGTNAVGVFGTQSQNTAFAPQSSFSAFGAQQQQALNVFGKSQSAFNTFGTQSAPAAWGTATAGFGTGWGQQPTNNVFQSQPSTVFGTLTNNAFQQPQQQTSSFWQPQPLQQQQSQQGAFFLPQQNQQQQQTPFSFNNTFQQQPQQQQQPFQTNWGFGTNTSSTGFSMGWGNQQPQQNAFSFAPSNNTTGFGFGFGTNNTNTWGQQFQKPTQAHFFFTERDPCALFWQWLCTLPKGPISSVSFGRSGIVVPCPTPAECDAMKHREKMRLAKVDADPYGLKDIRPLSPLPEQVALSTSVTDTLPTAAEASANVSMIGKSQSVPASPLRRGTSSPLLTPSRSPLILSTPHPRDTLHAPLGGQGRTQSVCAALSHSPRLMPLPESPYVADIQHAHSSHLSLTQGSHSPPTHSRSTSAYSSPQKNLSDRPVYSHHHHAPSAILFSSQAEANGGSPSRPIATPERRGETLAQREAAWAARLVE